MSNGQNHIIHSIKYDVLFKDNGVKDPQNDLSRLHYQQLENVLHRTCDNMSAESKYIVIDNLELDLGILAQDDWENHFSELMGKVLSEKINESISRSDYKIRQDQDEVDLEILPDQVIFSATEHEENTFLFFLENGHLKWTVPDGKSSSVNELFEKIILRKSNRFHERLISLFQHSVIALRRFLIQIRPPLQIEWMKSVSPGSEKQLNEIEQLQSHQTHKILRLPKAKADMLSLWLKEKFILYLIEQDTEIQSSKHFVETYSGEILDFISRVLPDMDPSQIPDLALKPETTLSNFIVELLIKRRGEIWQPVEKKSKLARKKSRGRPDTKRTAGQKQSNPESTTTDKEPETEKKSIVDPETSMDREIKGDKEKKDVSDKKTKTDFSETSREEIEPEIVISGDNIVAFDVETDKSKAKLEDLEKGLLAPNAGLVLLWPYLDILFKELQLLTDSRFKGESESIEALFVLHFLATGNTKAEEQNFLVPKIITGFDFEESMPIELTLEKSILKECDNLLETAIRNWTALKSTSPDGLREAFLQRPALIRLQDDGWNFMFERKGMDVLIDRLPYGLSIIKFRWLDHPIQVSW